MTEMGAKNICSDDSVRPDSNRKVTAMTLLSKDRHFYSFMVDTLNAGNTCRATNDTVTLSTDYCDWHIRELVRKHHAGSRCTYNTPSTDTDTELPYDYCLDYRWMKKLGAGSVCKEWALIYMCSLFGFMKELLLEAGVSTDRTMILDNDTITQNEWLFSDVDCRLYHRLTQRYFVSDVECVGDSMLIEQKDLITFTGCIIIHFMTEMGTKNICSDDSVRPDSNRKVTAMTLLSKDRHFYSFMVDTLNAGNTYRATNDTVTLSTDDCDWYIRELVRKHHAGSRCTYNTPSTDTDTELPYDYCLDYRWMKRLGAGSVCKEWTLIYMCSLFGFMKELLLEAGVSTDRTMILDNDTITQNEWLFSDVDCRLYYRLTQTYFVSDVECVGDSMLFERKDVITFTGCIIIHFMTEMGAKNSCSDNSVRPDSDTDITAMTLLSKDRHFYSFMVDTLDAGNTC